MKSAQSEIRLINDRGDGYDRECYNAWLRLDVSFEDPVHQSPTIAAD